MNKEILKAIGEALHGEQWVTPLSKDLNINRKTIQRYMNGELKINSGIASDLASLLSQRQDRIIKLRLFVDESFAAKDARLKAIKAFKRSDASKLTVESKVYCRLRYNNGYFKADIQLEKPLDMQGWQSHQFDEKYFMRDVVNLDEVLSEKLNDSMAIFDENLQGEYSLESSLLDFSY